MTYGYIQSCNSCSKTHPTRTKSTHARFRDDGFMIGEKATAHDVADFFKTAKYFRNLLRFACTTSPQGITFLHTTVYKGKRFKDSNVLDIKHAKKATAHDVADFFKTAKYFHNFLRFTCMTSPPRTHILAYHRIQRQKIQRLKRTGYQTCTKPTQTCRYFDRTSYHPDSVFHGFIKET